jgi:ABC-type nitrate/sulfonate/bicarbonate transport system substrate-binding protein
MNYPAWMRRVSTLPVWLPAAVGASLMLAAVAFAALTSPAELEEIVVAEAGQPSLALLYVAEAKGYFRDERVKVRFTTFTLGRDALDSVIAGHADIATVYQTPTLIRLYEGRPLAIVSTLHSSTRSHVIVARRDRGIIMPSDLRGRRIGVTPGTTTEYFLAAFLAAEGISSDAVQRENIEPAGYERALSTGAVDALVAFNPHPYTLERNLGKEALSVFRSDVFVETSLLVGLRDRLAAKAEATRRLLRALARAQEYAARHREESIAIVARRLGATQPEYAIREGWDSLRLGIGLDNVLLATLELEAEWMRSTRGVKGLAPDLEAALAPQYLNESSPEAVTIMPRPKRP